MFEKFYEVKNLRENKNATGFEIDCETIKGYLCDIANNYLLIAFRLYEIEINQSYKRAGYKNIVEACQDKLNFKKSTTYNLIGIVKRFGQPDECGRITYQSFVNNRYSYSQLCEMLSLSNNQIEKINPDMTVKEIREIKKTSEKVQTSGMIVSKDYLSDLVAMQAQRIHELELEIENLKNELKSQKRKCS